jgi:hypothetical protein
VLGKPLTRDDGWVSHSQVCDESARALEDHLISLLDVPLNLEGNARNAFHRSLSTGRAAAVARAKSLPVAPNPRVGGR